MASKSGSRAPAAARARQSTATGEALRRLYRGVTNAFKRDKSSGTKTWFNLEQQAAQKREWLELRSQQEKAHVWPEHMFEHLVIVGLSPTSNTHDIAANLAKEQKRRKLSSMTPSQLHRSSTQSKSYHSPPSPSYTPEVLYQFPEDKPLHMSRDQLASFCFPQGVTPTLLARTPSMSALNEVVYGKQHLVRGDRSFVFVQKGGDELPMFGICYYVQQMVHSAPGLSKDCFPDTNTSSEKHLVAAPRCYCFLSRYPFFKLHFQVLNVVLGFERLETIADFVQKAAANPSHSSLSGRLGYSSLSSLFTSTPTPSPVPDFSPPAGRGRSMSAFPKPPQLSSRTAAWRSSDCASVNEQISADLSWPAAVEGINSCETPFKSNIAQKRKGRFEREAKRPRRNSEIPAGVRSVSRIQDSCSSIPGIEKPRIRGSSCRDQWLLKRAGANLTVNVDLGQRKVNLGRSEGVQGLLQQPSMPDLSGVRIYNNELAATAPSPSPVGSLSPDSKSSTQQNNSEIGPSMLSATGVSPEAVPSSKGFATGLTTSREDSPTMNNCSLKRAYTVDGTLWVDRGSSATPEFDFDLRRVPSPFLQNQDQHTQMLMGGSWAHARSVSGQSLQGFDMEVCREASFSEELSERPMRSGHLRGDSAFRSPTGQSYSHPPASISESDMSHRQSRNSDTDLYMELLNKAAGDWGLGRTGSEELRCVTPAYSGVTQLYRSPSAEDLLAAISRRNLNAQDDEEQLQLSRARQVLLKYYDAHVPNPGEKFAFLPEEGVRQIEYFRPKVKLPKQFNFGDVGYNPKAYEELRAQIALIDEEASANLRLWSIAALCKCLSLDNILSLIAALMLEKQVVFFEPNIGVLTAAVLAVIPLLRPYVWQSLIMPVVPSGLCELLDAPVPFAVGLQHKTAEVVQKCSNLIRVNLYKDGIKNAPSPSSLPNCRQLYVDLASWHRRLRASKGFSRRPVHVVTSGEEAAADGFLNVLGKYLQNLCGDIRHHSITEVYPSGQRVSILLEESLISTYPQKDLAFMRAFMQTQMFSSYVDSVLS